MINLFISNSPAQNKIINSTGNKVTINLQSPIELASDKTYEARLLHASIIYCMPNITSKNNFFKYKYNNVVHTYNIPVGLYTLDALNKCISLLTLQQVGAESIFYFQADEATSQILTFFTIVASSIDCSGSNNVMQLLGYENDIEIGNFTGPTLDDSSYSLSTYRAKLNPITSILVKCNICQGSSYVDSCLSNVMATVVPQCAPWSNIYVEHYHPQRCLVTVKYIYKLEISLVDQDNNDLDFCSEGTESIPELWSLSISIEDIKRSDIL